MKDIENELDYVCILCEGKHGTNSLCQIGNDSRSEIE
jgi:hypothetical protein